MMADEKKPPSDKDKIPEAIRKHKSQSTLEMRNSLGNTRRKNDAYNQTDIDKQTAQEQAENNASDKGKESFAVSTEDMRQKQKGRLSAVFSRNKDGNDRGR